MRVVFGEGAEPVSPPELDTSRSKAGKSSVLLIAALFTLWTPFLPLYCFLGRDPVPTYLFEPKGPSKGSTEGGI